MKVLIVNTYDRGGAANACLRLHKGLLNNNIYSSVLLKNKQNQFPKTYQFKSRFKKKSKISKMIFCVNSFFNMLSTEKRNQALEKKFLDNRSNGLEWFSFPNSNIDITESKLYKDADIINLHWVGAFLDYESFFKKNTKPVVWTLHDMNPFSGGEHYEEQYLGVDDLGCPISRKRTDKEHQVFKQNITIKLQALSSVDNLIIVAPSIWLANEAKKSLAFKSKPIFCIPYGLDSDIYSIKDKNKSRLALNIPLGKKVVLFVADSIQNNRKGFTYLYKAFELLKRKDVLLCAIGRNNEKLSSLHNIVNLGHINDENKMSLVYAAADVFVIPSIMDNLPNTVLESLMCGTPVIGFPIGGIPDMIKHGFNGLIAKDLSVNSLSETLKNFLEYPIEFEREKIRIDTVKKYDLNVQAENYIKLFNNLYSFKN